MNLGVRGFFLTTAGVLTVTCKSGVRQAAHQLLLGSRYLVIVDSVPLVEPDLQKVIHWVKFVKPDLQKVIDLGKVC